MLSRNLARSTARRVRAARRARSRRAPLLAAAFVALTGCGYLAEKGEESRGTENLPSQGIGPWVKYDAVCADEKPVPPGASPDLSLQPVLLGSGVGHYMAEPSVVSDASGLTVFYEDRASSRSEIRRAGVVLGPEDDCRPATVAVLDDAIVLTPSTGGFERGRVGAPAVVQGASLSGVDPSLPTTYAMYYAGGNGDGIGLAVSADGRSWRRVGPDGREQSARAPEPLLTSLAQGWDAGNVGSPAVVQRPDGTWLLYFDGDRFGSRSIGVATSTDGVHWTRVGLDGRTGEAAGAIVTPSFTGPKEQTNWEFQRSDDPSSGSVGAPMVLLDRGPIRDLFILYYTGNLRGPLIDDYDAVDSSVGVAWSSDGIHFEKASTEVHFPDTANEVNPVLAEHFPLCVSNDDLACLLGAIQPIFDALHGPDGFCTEAGNELAPLCTRKDPGDGTPGSGSSNSLNPFFIVDEAEPSVVQLGERFVIFYHQQSDALNLLTNGLAQNGIAVALDNFRPF
ncbi:MAG: hypothetical protein U0610_29570 [bacterium]